MAAVTLCISAGSLTGCQTHPNPDAARDFRPLQQPPAPARSLVMPAFPPTLTQHHAATIASAPHTNPWYASRLDHGPAAFAGFRGTRITETQTRTFDQQQVVAGRVRDNFRQQRVTRSRVVTSQ